MPSEPDVYKIQVATTTAGARAQGGLTPDFLALSILGNEIEDMSDDELGLFADTKVLRK